MSGTLRAMTEAELHKSIVAWLDIALPPGSVYHHSPNEGRHKVQYRVEQRRLGVKSGWPDLEIFCPPKCWIAPFDWAPVFLEIKTAKGRLSPAQNQMLYALTDVGCHTAVVRSVDDVTTSLSQLMELRVVH